MVIFAQDRTIHSNINKLGTNSSNPETKASPINYQQGHIYYKNSNNKLSERSFIRPHIN